MTKILFLDLDGTVRKTKSGATFINDPYDQDLIPGAEEVIARYKDWRIVGITNQGGVSAGYKTIMSCVDEQRETLRLLPEIEFILFCPDSGDTCSGVFRTPSRGFSDLKYRILNGHEGVKDSFPGIKNFRKPDTGMILIAKQFIAGEAEEELFVGDRPEDQECARNANIPFMWAEDWRNGK